MPLPERRNRRLGKRSRVQKKAQVTREPNETTHLSLGGLKPGGHTRESRKPDCQKLALPGSRLCGNKAGFPLEREQAWISAYAGMTQ